MTPKTTTINKISFLALAIAMLVTPALSKCGEECLRCSSKGLCYQCSEGFFVNKSKVCVKDVLYPYRWIMVGATIAVMAILALSIFLLLHCKRTKDSALPSSGRGTAISGRTLGTDYRSLGDAGTKRTLSDEAGGEVFVGYKKGNYEVNTQTSSPQKNLTEKKLEF